MMVYQDLGSPEVLKQLEGAVSQLEKLEGTVSQLEKLEGTVSRLEKFEGTVSRLEKFEDAIKWIKDYGKLKLLKKRGEKATSHINIYFRDLSQSCDDQGRDSGPSRQDSDETIVVPSKDGQAPDSSFVVSPKKVTFAPLDKAEIEDKIKLAKQRYKKASRAFKASNGAIDSRLISLQEAVEWLEETVKLLEESHSIIAE